MGDDRVVLQLGTRWVTSKTLVQPRLPAMEGGIHCQLVCREGTIDSDGIDPFRGEDVCSRLMGRRVGGTGHSVENEGK